MTDRLQEQLSSFAWSLKSSVFFAADVIDKQADAAATIIRESLSNSPWVPEVVRPPTRVPARITENVAGGGIVAWVRENKWAVGVVVGTAVGIGGYVYAQGRKGRKNKRARKASDGGRKEVVG